MPATLSWINHDPDERERVTRILALFRERDSIDELGLGAIRDSFGDQLFPGTSTIQTRLRYFFFVPWVFQELEARRVPSHKAAAWARERQLELTLPLLESGDTSGVFGKAAGRSLKRLPAEVYWYGLGTWQFRLFEGSESQYIEALDTIYQRRSRVSRKDDGEVLKDPLIRTWHPRLPTAPDGFPDNVTFRLTPAEVEFLKDRLSRVCPDSLWCFLALHPVDPIVLDATEFPWEHPASPDFPEEIQDLLEQARLFSEAMYGATLTYNLSLAELARKAELVDEHREGFEEWADSLDVEAIRRWDLNTLWASAVHENHTITPQAKRFVEAWVGLVAGTGDLRALADHSAARQLVERRERLLKKGRSRYANRRALDQWGGRSGIGQMSYRWRNVKTLLGDLHAQSEPTHPLH